MHIGEEIRPGAVVSTGAGDVDAVFCGGAAIPIHSVVQGKQITIGVTAHLELDNQCLADKVGVEFFFTGENQFDRPAFNLGGNRDGYGFHGDASFTAEPATNKGGDYAHITLGDSQGTGDNVALSKWGLGSCPQGNSAVILKFGNSHMRLDGHMLHMRDIEF